MGNKKNRKMNRKSKKETTPSTKGFCSIGGSRPWEKRVSIENLNFNYSRPSTSEELDKITASCGLINEIKSEKVVLDLVDIMAISQLIKMNTRCVRCKKSKCLSLNSTRRAGLASDFTLQCEDCGVLGKTDNSTKREYQFEGKSHYLESINFAIINAARIAGFGRTAAQRFFSFLNLRSPPDNWVC